MTDPPSHQGRNYDFPVTIVKDITLPPPVGKGIDPLLVAKFGEMRRTLAGDPTGFAHLFLPRWFFEEKRQGNAKNPIDSAVMREKAKAWFKSWTMSHLGDERDNLVLKLVTRKGNEPGTDFPDPGLSLFLQYANVPPKEGQKVEEPPPPQPHSKRHVQAEAHAQAQARPKR